MKTPTIVSVFGSSGPKAGTPDYAAAFEVGQRLAQTGYAVMTGGYTGVMAAASEGAASVGGHVIGVTADQIEQWRPLPPNQWLTEQIRFETLRDRLHYLVTTCDAAVAMPGGIGTLTEIMLAWNMMAVEEMPAKPLVAVGQQWQATFDAMFSHGDSYMSAPQRALLQFAATPVDAVALIEQQMRGA